MGWAFLAYIAFRGLFFSTTGKMRCASWFSNIHSCSFSWWSKEMKDNVGENRGF